MEHPSEHSIELFVLRAPQEDSERDQIVAHLKECSGCRSLADDAEAFYGELHVEMLNRPAGSAHPSRSLVAAPRRIPEIFDMPFREGRLSRVIPHGPLRRFVRAHPFVVGGGGLALLGACVALILTLEFKPARDLNPVTVIENGSQSTLDAYNRAGERLWSHPVPHLDRYIRQEESEGRKLLQVADLNGDGRNEIITSLPVSPGATEDDAVLSILSEQNTVIRTIKPGEPVTCRGRMYPDDYRICGFGIGDFSGTGKNEILILSNHLHSPSILSRYDGLGRRLGTYRHFGSLYMMGVNPVAVGDRKEFVLYGGSDSEEGKYTAVILGLDPSRITGDGESSFSGGFGLPRSPAELQYARIPPTEVARAYGLQVRILSTKALPLQDGPGFRVVVTTWPDTLPIYFEYIFRTDFSTVEVKSTNETKQLFDRLAPRHLVAGSFFDDYMKVVAAEVRYWDGSRWQARPAALP